MDKLTLEHLAPYLPYGLKLFYADGSIRELRYLDVTGICPVFKPILRPLCDLTKEIEHNSERFVPKNRIDQYTQVGGDGKLYLLVDGALWSCNPLSWDYSTVLKLISWHFDVFGFIDNGLAIDFNTLKLKNNG